MHHPAHGGGGIGCRADSFAVAAPVVVDVIKSGRVTLRGVIPVGVVVAIQGDKRGVQQPATSDLGAVVGNADAGLAKAKVSRNQQASSAAAHQGQPAKRQCHQNNQGNEQDQPLLALPALSRLPICAA